MIEASVKVANQMASQFTAVVWIVEYFLPSHVEESQTPIKTEIYWLIGLGGMSGANEIPSCDTQYMSSSREILLPGGVVTRNSMLDTQVTLVKLATDILRRGTYTIRFTFSQAQVNSNR